MYRIETVGLTGGKVPPVESFQTYAEDLHRMGWRGQGVTVAIVDSGVDLRDPATAAAVVGGTCVVPGYASDDLQDRIGHGALVARIILALAPEAKLHPIRIFGETGATATEVAATGMALAAEQGDLTNASIGGPYDPVMGPPIRRHEELHKPLVAAAGNTGDGVAETPELDYPGADDYCTTIGAIDRSVIDPSWDWSGMSLRPAQYSTSHPQVDAVAIGRIPGSWDEGTSFAAPVVTGLLACYISMARATGRPADDDACYEWLRAMTRQLPGLAARNDQTGWGQVTCRPYQVPRILEIDVDTLAATLNGQALDLASMGVENRAPGGLYGWVRPFCDRMGLPVSYDAKRRKAQYRN